VKPYYQQDNITIYHGDCRDVLPTLPFEFDLVCTDPPFGIYDRGGKWGRKSELKWDKKPADNIADLLARGREIVIWGGNYFALPPSRGWLVWYKHDSVQSAADVELAWTNRDMNARLIDHTISATNAERVGHPTQKPLRVMQWTLSQMSPASTLLDPFAGSGTTLVAAKLACITAIGVEINEAYCELAANRLRQGVLFGTEAA
jgi:site-specific DNA-methyltransferase (adenine-specific)